MNVLKDLAPQAVMHWFEVVCSIPHPSLREEKLSAFLMQFARERNLECIEDASHNVLIRKPASPGREDRPGLVLQSHIDMICAVEEGVEHDFDTQGLDLYIDGDKIRARGTTLGADNGIGVAYQLAILDDDTLVHPAIEAVFTTAEEIGMVGASHFDAGQLRGRTMINFDAGGFTEGRIYVGCAGNQKALLRQSITFDPCEVRQALRIDLTGLQGGHSGGDIQKGRGNSSLLLGRLLALLLQENAQILSLSSGDTTQENKNGIPAQCTVLAYPADLPRLTEALRRFESHLQDELRDVDDGVCLRLSAADGAARVLSQASVETLSRLLQVLPNGVFSMQHTFADVPECSCNIGNVEIDGDQVLYYLSARSCKESLLEYMCGKWRAAAALSGAVLEEGLRLPGWDYDPGSPVRQLVQQEYVREFSTQPRFKVTHASTECSLFKKAVPDMDIISMGPIIYDEHTPREYMGIESVGILWTFVKNILNQL